MPRRRKIEIKASELECFETLVAELSRRVEFVDFDMASLRVWAYESYEQELKGVEKAKIACAKKLFNDVSTSDVRFGAISNYDELLNIIQGA